MNKNYFNLDVITSKKPSQGSSNQQQGDVAGIYKVPRIFPGGPEPPTPGPDQHPFCKIMGKSLFLFSLSFFDFVWLRIQGPATMVLGRGNKIIKD